MNKIELLAPAGNLEKAKIAILYAGILRAPKNSTELKSKGELKQISPKELAYSLSSPCQDHGVQAFL